MMISTRGRYVLRVMVDLAEHAGEGYIPMKDVAKRQEVSLKYLERILPPLTKGGYITAVHGKGGGYQLTRRPDEYKIGDILRVAEGDLSPVSCLESNGEKCDRMEGCKTRPMWEKLNIMINDFFDGITLGDLIRD